MKIESKIKKFENAGAVVSEYLNGQFLASFKNGVVVVFCELSQSISYGYDEATQETLRFFLFNTKKSNRKSTFDIGDKNDY